ncbi:MAG TPA: ECF transporter S component [Pseudoflavonifractor sp.]|nr:ECF transporter S component [Pseudoflavonifractor sp.]
MRNNTRRLTFAALCIALGIVLPITLHAIPNAGSIFLPMHVPVLLCGLLCGWPYGLVCGIVTPILSSVLTGMPPAAYLPGMVAELAIYGLVAGLVLRLVRTKSELLNLYIALVSAMLAGRLAMGVLNALLFRAGSYSMQLWVTGMFVTALPGIAIQLVLLPVLVRSLSGGGAAARS